MKRLVFLMASPMFAVLLIANHVYAAADQAVFVYPADGAKNVDVPLTFEWTGVENAQGYYLYVGTSVGAKDLVNTGLIQTTSHTVSYLPPGRTLYALISTKVADGKWIESQAAFTAAGKPVATFLYPRDREANVDLNVSFQWTEALGAQAYALTVGTTPGGKDLLDTGELQTTAYTLFVLPTGRWLYGRIATKTANGVWASSEVVFTAEPNFSVFVHPPDAAARVALPVSFRWTAARDAEAYSLFVGTKRGEADLINTGVIRATSYTVPYLPPERTLYARVNTKRVDGAWDLSDVTFTVAGKPVATFLHPADHAVNVNLNEPYRWTEVVGVRAYALTVGTKPGAKDLLDTGEIQGTSYLGPLLPAGRTFYARISTKRPDGSWVSTDVRFSSARKAVATFIHPADGSMNVDLKRPFRWAAVPGAASYVLQVGSTPGGNDLLDTGETRATTYDIRSLPSGRVLFARIRTKFKVKEVGLGKSQWGNSDVRFRLDGSATIPEMIFPRDGATGIDAGRPFQWSAVELARGYRLEIGTRPGANDLEDSQEIAVTRRFLYGLPAAKVLHGRISANVGGRWHATDFSFSVGKSSAPEPHWIDSALWATGRVREMADAGNDAFGWTTLWNVVHGRGFMFAYCSEYATALHLLLQDMNIHARTRTRDVYLNDRDGHTLMEMLQGDGKDWMLLDPTFGLSVTRTSDGRWATTDDMSKVAGSGKRDDISYVFTSSYGDAILRSYSIDYPTLYLRPSPPRPAGSQ